MAYFPTRILLATDGSPDAALALRAAVDLSTRAASELHVVHAWQALPSYPHPSIAMATDPGPYEQEAQRVLFEIPPWARERPGRWPPASGRSSGRRSFSCGLVP